MYFFIKRKIFPSISIIFPVQAVCLPHTYTFRTRRIGLGRLLSGYVLPSVSLAVLLNIPRFLGELS